MATKRAYPCRDVPEGCYCRCHAVAMAHRPRARGSRPTDFLPRHDRCIREAVAQGRHPAEIASQLTAQFGIARTEGSIRQRIRRLGLSTRTGWWSRDDVIRLLGISERKLLALEQRGLISETPYGRWRRYHLDTLEALVRAEAGRAIDPRRVKDARLRGLAETAALAHRRTASR